MGLMSQHPEDEDPLPYFYEKESAAAIAKFDAIGSKGLVSFDKFRNSVAEKFPDNVRENQDGRLEVALDAYAGMKIRSFTYNASMIAPQLRERKPSDYEFVSATEPEESNIAQITVKILGNEKTIPVKKTAEGYRMFLTEDVLENLYETIKKVEQLEQIFSEANQMVENGEITDDNFEVKMEAISLKYQNALD
jgi:hypothetical protein